MSDSGFEGVPAAAGVGADWGALRTAADVDRVLAALFGTPAVGEGVLHVAAVAVQAQDGDAAVMRIVDATPRSLLDRFLLLAARARAEALVTTGRILREEPRLAHALAEHPAAAALARWRRERMGLPHPPRLLVLTARGELDPAHPALAVPGAVLFTSPEGAARLAPHLRGSPLEPVVDSAPDARRAVQWLREREGLVRITVEAGPTAASALYAPPPMVDALWLSTFRGTLPPAVRGPAFVPAARLDAALPHRPHPPRTVDEPSGPWRVEQRLASRG